MGAEGLKAYDPKGIRWG